MTRRETDESLEMTGERNEGAFRASTEEARA